MALRIDLKSDHFKSNGGNFLSIFYFEDENGTFLSTNGERRFIRLRGKEAYDYMKAHKHRHFYFYRTETKESYGEKVFVEIQKKSVKKCRVEFRRKQYIAECKAKSDISFISLDEIDENNEEVFSEDIISALQVDFEDDVLKEIDLEILRRALKVLSDTDLKIVRSLYLLDEPVSETELAKDLGVPRTTLQYRKQKIFEKLKEYF